MASLIGPKRELQRHFWQRTSMGGKPIGMVSIPIRWRGLDPAFSLLAPCNEPPFWPPSPTNRVAAISVRELRRRHQTQAATI